MEFKILKESKKSKARLGIIKTKNGLIETPCFVPVATQATIKALNTKEVEDTKSQVLICNTFHLHLKPGEKVIKKTGQLHSFMNWNKPLMTDSGGFQVFSLGFGRDIGIGKILKNNNLKNFTVNEFNQPKSVRITDKGVFFNSPVDGKKLFIGPKESIRIQEDLGADIIFTFDECTPPTADYNYTKKSLIKTHKWAKDCLNYKKSKQAIFGIVQGGRFKDLRIESAKFISSLDFNGFGIGGEFGGNKKGMIDMLESTIYNLPANKPRHLLGIGYLEDIEKIIKQGIDTFDCIVPTHYARRGIAFINLQNPQKIDLKKSIYLKENKPLDKKCDCFVCQNYKRNYISHLLRAKEITPLSLLTFHNLYFFNCFVENIKTKIKNNKV